MKLAVIDTLRTINTVVMKDLGGYGGFPFFGVVIVSTYLLNIAGFALQLLTSLVVVTLIVGALRLAHFKPRPGMPRKNYDSLYERIDNSSFPSIHAARSVIISMFFYLIVPSLWPVYMFMILAVLFSRLKFKRHDVEDLIIGVIVGYVVGYYFFVF